MLLVCTVYSVLYSEMAVSRTPFGIGHMYMYTFLLIITDTMTSKNTDLSSWDTLYMYMCIWMDGLFKKPMNVCVYVCLKYLRNIFLLLELECDNEHRTYNFTNFTENRPKKIRLVGHVLERS
jgi:hypothetical protein